MPSVKKALAEIERAGNLLIKELFLKPGVVDSMATPIYTVQRRGRRQTSNGWYVPDSWHSRTAKTMNALAGSGKVAISLDEITIAAESLNAPVLEILHTLHHELAHHACRVKNVRDFAQNGVYHTVGFRGVAEASGLKCEQNGGSRGYAYTEPTAATKKLYREIGLDPGCFEAYRIPEEETDRAPKRKAWGQNNTSKNKRWTCGCGVNVRCAVGGGKFRAKCDNCGTYFRFNDNCGSCGKPFEQTDVRHGCYQCGWLP